MSGVGQRVAVVEGLELEFPDDLVRCDCCKDLLHGDHVAMFLRIPGADLWKPVCADCTSVTLRWAVVGAPFEGESPVEST